jgi:Tfp pilus assembly protein PilV
MKRIRATSGFTVIETLIAMMVLTTAATAMLGMLTMSVVKTRESVQESRAVSLAVQERENLRSLVYSAIVTRDPYTTGSPYTAGDGVNFAVHSDVADDQPAANMKTVTVTTSWTYSLQTVYANING